MHGRGRTNLPKWVSTWSNQWERKCESNFNAKGCSGIRTAIVPKPAVASEGTVGFADKIMVNGPGQNLSANS
jgi:hypothetical protein